MSNAHKRPLFNSLPVLKDERQRAPSSDDRHDLVRAYDRSGNPREITKIHLREALKLGWTQDEAEAARRLENPLPPLSHGNPELGPNGHLPKFSIPRTSSPVIGGVQQFPITAEPNKVA